MPLKPLLAAAAVIGSMLTAAPAVAQSYPYWRDGWGEPQPRYVRPFRDDDRWSPPGAWRAPPPPYGYSRPLRDPEDERPYARPPVPATPMMPYERRNAANEPPSANKRDGGPRPAIAPIPPQLVPFNSTYAPGTVIIETKGRQLLLVTSRRAALRYPISVGREGFQWTGREKISRIADWPDWHPPAQMRKRDPSLPEMMTGGLRNPLGAKALYLGSTLYRIHGTNDARTIGYASSSGCFRMLNGHVVDLSGRVGVGTPVVVVDRLPRESFLADAYDRGSRRAY